MNVFDDLKASLDEAVEISRGKKKAGKVTRYSPEQVKTLRQPLQEQEKAKKKAGSSD